MTRAEVEKAYEEGTWLAYDSPFERETVCLAKITLIEDLDNVIVRVDGLACYASISNLRIATPNDFLKYGKP